MSEARTGPVRKRPRVLACALVFACVAVAACAPPPTPREAARDALGALLAGDRVRTDAGLVFATSPLTDFAFGATLEGLVNAEAFTVLAFVNEDASIDLYIAPTIGGGQVLLDNAADPDSLRAAVTGRDSADGLSWQLTPTGALQAAVTFTQDDGFPEAGLLRALEGLRGLDTSLGELRPFIDGPAPAPALPPAGGV